MISFSEFRLAPIHRDATTLEKLAGVPEGTFEKFEAEIENISEQILESSLPRERESEIREKFNIMRIDSDIRLYHDFSQNWFGKPTAETVMLFSKWGFVQNGIMTPGAVKESEKVKALLKTQLIELPKGLKVQQIGGIEWNDRLALQLGRIREVGR